MQSVAPQIMQRQPFSDTGKAGPAVTSQNAPMPEAVQ